MDDLATVCSGYPLVSSKLAKMLGFEGYLPLPLSTTPRSKQECCGTADLGNAGQISFTDPRYALLTLADNTALPGFLYFYTCLLGVSLHRIIFSINFPLIYMI